MEHSTIILVAAVLAFCALFGFLAERWSKTKCVRMKYDPFKPKLAKIDNMPTQHPVPTGDTGSGNASAHPQPSQTSHNPDVPEQRNLKRRPAESNSNVRVPDTNQTVL